MSDSLVDRLKKLAGQEKKGREAEQESADFQQRVSDFISDKAQPEYDRLLSLLNKRLEEINPSLGTELPQFQFNLASRMIQQGNSVAVIHFDKPITNRPDNALLVSFGPHPHAQYFLEAPPASKRYRLQAAASDSLDRIVWVGDLGELETQQVVDFIIESLTTYYLEHKPRQS